MKPWSRDKVRPLLPANHRSWGTAVSIHRKQPKNIWRVVPHLHHQPYTSNFEVWRPSFEGLPLPLKGNSIKGSDGSCVRQSGRGLVSLAFGRLVELDNSLRVKEKSLKIITPHVPIRGDIFSSFKFCWEVENSSFSPLQIFGKSVNVLADKIYALTSRFGITICNHRRKDFIHLITVKVQTASMCILIFHGLWWFSMFFPVEQKQRCFRMSSICAALSAQW